MSEQYVKKIRDRLLLFFFVFSIFLSVFFSFSTVYSTNPSNPPNDKINTVKELDVQGIWDSEDGIVYSIKKQVDVYVVNCTTGDIGIGKLSGKTFIFSFCGKTTRVGLAIYHIEVTDEGTKLVGSFTTIPGDGKWIEEVLTKIK